MKFAALVIASLLLSLSVASCAGRSPQVHYYTLNALPGQAPGGAIPSLSKELSLEVGPITLPQALARQQIVTRSGQNEIVIHDYHRWAGDLEREVDRVVSENLSALLATNRIVRFGTAPYGRPDYRIIFVFEQFDGRLGEEATLKTRWAIVSPGVPEPHAVRQALLSEPLTDSSVATFVAAQSRMLNRLCMEIATEILHLMQ